MIISGLTEAGLCGSPRPIIFPAMDARKTAILLSAMSLFTHLLLLGGKSFWVDEAYAAGLMHLSPGEVVELSSMSTPHPPGAFLLMRVSAALAGRTEAGVRLLNALVMASGVIPLFFLSRRLFGSDRGAFLASMVWVLSPYSVALGQEAWVYGFPAALALWCFHLASLPFRDRLAVPAAWFLVCLAGLWTQFSFVLVVVSSLGLMAARGGVTGRAWAFMAAALLLWAPLVAGQAPAMRERSARLSQAGMTLRTVPFRLARNAPLAASGLLADGLVPQTYREIIEKPLNIAIFGGTVLMILAAMAALALDDSIPLSVKIWAFTTAAAPFGLFLVDVPGDRQIYLSAVPLALGLGVLYNRRRWTAVPSLVFMAILLGYWYTLDTSAYHRSDWRGAASYVGSRAEPGDAVLVHSGQSGGIAWDLSGGCSHRIALGGDADPWSADRVRSDPAGVADSILSEGERLWLVADLWGETPLPPGRDPREISEFGRDMRVYLFVP